MSRVTQPDPDGAGSGVPAWTNYVRDSLGNLVQTSDRLNQTHTVTARDAWFRTLSWYVGNSPTNATDPSGLKEVINLDPDPQLENRHGYKRLESWRGNQNGRTGTYYQWLHYDSVWIFWSGNSEWGGRIFEPDIINGTPDSVGIIASKSASASLQRFGRRGLDANQKLKSKWSECSNGMVDSSGTIGYRIEFDEKIGAHINVFAGKEKGPHFVFPATEAELKKLLQQVF